MYPIHCVDTANRMKGFSGRFCSIIKLVFELEETRYAGQMELTWDMNEIYLIDIYFNLFNWI